MRFDYNMFDTLADMKLFHYAKGNADQDLVDSEDVKMLRLRAAKMDLHHCEMMLLFLAKSQCKEAHDYLAEFLHHPNLSLRFISSKLVAQLGSADENVMQHIVQALRGGGLPGLSEELDGILHRPTNDKAKAIAEEFLKAKAMGHE